MAIERHNTLVLTPQIPPGQRGERFVVGRFSFGVPCGTADDVRARAAQVTAFRAKVWPLRRPTAPPPASPPARKVPALLVQFAEKEPAVPGRITVRRVIEVTAEHFDMTVKALLSDSRKQPLVRRRQVAMFVANRLTGRSLPFIANKMGGWDHTTILHGVRAVKALLEAGDAATVEAVDAIVERLQVTGGAHA